MEPTSAGAQSLDPRYSFRPATMSPPEARSHCYLTPLPQRKIDKHTPRSGSATITIPFRSHSSRVHSSTARHLRLYTTTILFKLQSDSGEPEINTIQSVWEFSEIFTFEIWLSVNSGGREQVCWSVDGQKLIPPLNLSTFPTS